MKTIVGIRRDLKTLAETRFRLGLDNDQPFKIAVADYEAAFKRQAAIRDQLDVQRHLLARLAGKGRMKRPICLPNPWPTFPNKFLRRIICRSACWSIVRIWLQPCIERMPRLAWSGGDYAVLSHYRSHGVCGI